MGALRLMRCEDVLARLWDFLDGELLPGEENTVQRHLELCNRCYPQYDFRRAYLRFTRRVRDRERASPELRRRLFRAILEEETRSEEQR